MIRQTLSAFKKMTSSTYLIICVLIVLPIFIITGAQVYDIKTTVMQERKLQAKFQSQAAYDVVMYFYKLELSGDISKSMAQSYALGALRNMRYDETNYFWINNTQGILIMHPYRPELENKSLLGVKDKNGTRVFSEIIKIANSTKEGYMTYYWPKPNGVEELEKISYIRLFNPWGWVIGTGVYAEDINKKIEKLIFDNVTLAILVLILSMFITSTLFKKIESQCKKCHNKGEHENV